MPDKAIKSKVVYIEASGRAGLSFIRKLQEKRVYVTNKKLYKLLGLSILQGRKIIIPADGEKCKSFSNAALIIREFLKRNVLKSDIITVIGGGALCDIGAFCASIYKRGSRLSLAPTSLLAMIDAAHGGKTALNESGIKNCVGSFYPASEIVIYADFLTSLPAAEIESGLFEALKYGILFSKKLFVSIISQQKRLIKYDAANRELFIDIIKKCVRYKSKITAADPFEKNERLALNFGHTFGHALESAAVPKLSHGYAVGLGMFMELLLARFKYGENKENLNTAGMLLEFIRNCGAYKTLNGVIRQKGIFKKLLRYIIHDKKAGAAGGAIIMPAVKRPGLYSLEEISVCDDIKPFLKEGADIIDAWNS